MVASAGNNGGLFFCAPGILGINYAYPAGYSEVVAVTAFIDYDGRPGGLQFTVPASCSAAEFDDSALLISSVDQSLNFSHRAHMMQAPGGCINSTYLTAQGFYNVLSGKASFILISPHHPIGTSMSCPHVSASAALCFSGYQCSPIPNLPQDMLTKLVSDSRRYSVPMTFIPGPYDLASFFAGDISPNGKSDCSG